MVNMINIQTFISINFLNELFFELYILQLILGVCVLMTSETENTSHNFFYGSAVAQW